MSQQIIRTDGVTKRYQQRSLLQRLFRRDADEIVAVKDVDLALERGQALGVVGESGSGKSTLGEMLVALETPTRGDVLFEEESIVGRSLSDRRDLWRDIQIIYQDPYSALNPKFTIEALLREPIVNLRGITDTDQIDAIITGVMEDVGLHDPYQYLSKYPNQLSGGQLQRINIARALVTEPHVLIADEPVSMLDLSHRTNIIRLFKSIVDEYDLSLVFISHNIAVVKLLCDHIVVMKDGEIVERGSADAVVEHPEHAYTELLIENIPEIDV